MPTNPERFDAQGRRYSTELNRAMLRKKRNGDHRIRMRKRAVDCVNSALAMETHQAPVSVDMDLLRPPKTARTL
jgi:hypothetical protein